MESVKHIKRPKRSAGELKTTEELKVVTFYSHSIMFKVHNVNKVKFSIHCSSTVIAMRKSYLTVKMVKIDTLSKIIIINSSPFYYRFVKKKKHIHKFVKVTHSNKI